MIRELALRVSTAFSRSNVDSKEEDDSKEESPQEAMDEDMLKDQGEKNDEAAVAKVDADPVADADVNEESATPSEMHDEVNEKTGTNENVTGIKLESANDEDTEMTDENDGKENEVSIPPSANELEKDADENGETAANGESEVDDKESGSAPAAQTEEEEGQKSEPALYDDAAEEKAKDAGGMNNSDSTENAENEAIAIGGGDASSEMTSHPASAAGKETEEGDKDSVEVAPPSSPKADMDGKDNAEEATNEEDTAIGDNEGAEAEPIDSNAEKNVEHDVVEKAMEETEAVAGGQENAEPIPSPALEAEMGDADTSKEATDELDAVEDCKENEETEPPLASTADKDGEQTGSEKAMSEANTVEGGKETAKSDPSPALEAEKGDGDTVKKSTNEANALKDGEGSAETEPPLASTSDKESEHKKATNEADDLEGGHETNKSAPSTAPEVEKPDGDAAKKATNEADAAKDGKESAISAPPPQSVTEKDGKVNATFVGEKDGENKAKTATNKSDGKEKAKADALPFSLRDTKLPPLPQHLRGMEKLDTLISIECQKFLIEMNVFTASTFLLADVQYLADKYQEWRHARNSTITPVSARVYMNKYRKVIRDALLSAGVSVTGSLGKTRDFIVASSERVIEAERELLASMSSGSTPQNVAPKKPKSSQPKIASSPASTKKARFAYEQPRPIVPNPVRNELGIVSFILTEPGTFGLKVENTAMNGVRVTGVLAGLQGERAGFQRGDIISTASTVISNVEPNAAYLMEQNMPFDTFVRLAQDPVRPVKIWVKRLPQDAFQREAARMPIMPSMKRARNDAFLPARYDRPRKRIRPAEHSLQQFRLQKLRAMRMEIIRADGLREAAEAFDKSMVKALANCPIAMQKAKDTAQIMREESVEIWRNESHGEWEYFLKCLLNFKRHNGHVNVPTSHSDKELLRFISGVKANYRALKKGEFKKSRRRNEIALEVEIFNKIGFKWGSLSSSEDWEKGFKQLCEYKERYGTIIIPKERRKGRYTGLHGWILQQRRNYANQENNVVDVRRSARLSDDQIDRLNEIGFAWTADDERTWDSYFEDLLQFKLKHGHCKVPVSFRENKPLARWVVRMRELKKQVDEGKESDVLTQERMDMLQYFGFDWEGHGSGGKRTK